MNVISPHRYLVTWVPNTRLLDNHAVSLFADHATKNKRYRWTYHVVQRYLFLRAAQSQLRINSNRFDAENCDDMVEFLRLEASSLFLRINPLSLLEKRRIATMFLHRCRPSNANADNCVEDQSSSQTTAGYLDRSSNKVDGRRDGR